MAAHAAEPADALLTDPAFAGGAFLLGHPLGERPPLVVCGVIPLMIASRDTAPYGMGLTPLRGPLGRLRNAAAERARRSHRVPPSGAAGRRGQPRAARAAAAVPGPRLATARRGDRAVHGRRVRVPALRRTRDPALRRPDLGHRLTGAAAALVGRARRLTARRPRHPGHDREPRLPTDHRPDTRGARRRRRARGRLHRRTPARHAPAAARERARRRRTCPTTNSCPRPTSTSPTAATAASSTPCATAFRSSRAAARRTSPRSPAGSRGPASAAASRPRPPHPQPSAPRYARCSTTRSYRENAQRIAASMARAGGLEQLAEIVDGLASHARTTTPE